MGAQNKEITADTNDWDHEGLEQDGIYGCGKLTVLSKKSTKNDSLKTKISLILLCPA